jgi:DNA-directed RNA polymerase specialized sigma24 family protein
MKKKTNELNPQDYIDVLSKVAKNHRSKSFDYHTEDDIEQESYLIALSKLKEFVPSRGKSDNLNQSLENWLNTVVSRRLKNFYRDKYVVPQKSLKSDRNLNEQSNRVNLMHPLNLHDISDESFKFIDTKYVDNDIWITIINALDDDMKDVLEAILSGQTIKCYYRNKLYRCIKSILS